MVERVAGDLISFEAREKQRDLFDIDFEAFINKGRARIRSWCWKVARNRDKHRDRAKCDALSEFA